MADLVPLKVKIALKPDGGHAFPAFNDIPADKRGNADWSVFVDRFGGWHYDQTSGHGDEDPQSPAGTWLGMLMVPADFAAEAKARFPAQVEEMSEVDAAAFYNTRCHVRDPAELRDPEVLRALADKKALGVPLTPDDLAALDPNMPQAGLRTNPEKTFAGYKQRRAINVVRIR